MAKQEDSSLSSYSTSSSKVPRLPNFSSKSIPAPTKRLSSVLAALLIIFGVGFGGGWLGARAYNHGGSPAASKDAKIQYVSGESQLIADIAKNVGPSVVSVDVKSQVSTTDIFGFSFGDTSQESAGTGFIIDPSGIIMTNRHVVPDGTSSVSVTLSD